MTSVCLYRNLMAPRTFRQHLKWLFFAAFLGGAFVAVAPAFAQRAGKASAVAVGPQYSSTHVYVAPADFDRFVDSVLGTFGGSKSKAAVVTVTPTPSLTMSQLVQTPVGMMSVLGFKTPIPYPFGSERTGYLVADLDIAVRSAAANGADVVVAPFNDPIGRDAIVMWPGGVAMQLYWHTVAPNYPALQSIPENRIYLSAGRADVFIRGFLNFSGGKVVADNRRAPGAEIGRPGEVYRRVRISSGFGALAVLATDGHLPYPFGREITGYEVADLAGTLAKAKTSGANILVGPYSAEDRRAALVQFPGGYIAELHAAGGD
jgi:predicted enzyme related to lactoylglutathione lyase